MALLAGEIFLRLFFPIYLPDLVSLSSHEGWYVRSANGEIAGLAPNFRGRFFSSEFDTRIELNERGFRDKFFAAKRAARICVLGDSFTFGYGVEADSAYPQQLEKNLQARGYDVEVYNLGVPGTATALQYRIFQNLLDLKPDLVILGILATYADRAGNDLIDNLEFAEKNAATDLSQTNPSVRTSMVAPALANDNAPLSQKFFYQFHAGRRWLLKNSQLYRRGEMAIGQEHPRWLGNWQAQASRQRVEKGWVVTQEWLRRFQELARQQQFSFVLLHIPFPDFRSEENWQCYRLLESFSQEQQIVFVDPLLPLLRNRRWQPRDLYFVLDGHWRPRAHRLCAEVLADFLVQKNLLPSSSHAPAI